MENQTEKPTTYIRQRQLLNMLPFSSSTLWRLVSKGEFPQPIKLSAGVTAWSISDVNSWLESKAMLQLLQ